MLGKCLKYEIKSFSRVMLPLIAVFGFAWMSEFLFMSIGIRRGEFLAVLLWIIIFPMMLLSLVGIPVVSCLLGAKRYNDVLFSSKAYLMRPLPVKGRTLVISIFLNSILWYIISVAVIFLTLLLPSLVSDPGDFLDTLGSVLRSLITNHDKWLSVLISTFVSMIFFELMIMLSVSFAARHNGSRFGLTFLFFIAVSFASSVLHSIIIRASGTEYTEIPFVGDMDIVTLSYRVVLSVLMLAYLLWHADKKADVMQ